MGIIDYNGEIRFFSIKEVLKKTFVTICEQDLKAIRIVQQEGKHRLLFEKYPVTRRMDIVRIILTFPDGVKGKFYTTSVLARKNDTLIPYVECQLI